MPSRLTLMLLACASCVVGYLAWKYQRPRRGTTQDRPHPAQRQGERTMPSGMVGPEGERVHRWLADSPTVFRGVRQVLDERDQLTVAVAVSQQECQRLRQQRDTLRETAGQLQAENARLQTERADAARWFATMLQEASARFPLTPPSA